MKTLALLLLLCGSLSAAPLEKVIRARVYFVPWEVVTSTAMWPSEARAQASMRALVSTRQDITDLVGFIPLAGMVKNPQLVVQDVRLVIDFEGAGGEVTTFIASRLAISTEKEPDVNCPIDARFRDGFETWLKRRANQSAQHNAMAWLFSVFKSRSSRG